MRRGWILSHLQQSAWHVYTSHVALGVVAMTCIYSETRMKYVAHRGVEAKIQYDTSTYSEGMTRMHIPWEDGTRRHTAWKVREQTHTHLLHPTHTHKLHKLNQPYIHKDCPRRLYSIHMKQYETIFIFYTARLLCGVPDACPYGVSPTPVPDACILYIWSNMKQYLYSIQHYFYGVATISRIDKIISRFCKGDL